MNIQAPFHSLLFLLPATLLVTSCSWDSIQRTSYETVESMHRQQCLDNPDADCPATRTRYESYQSEREQLKEEER